MNARARYLCLTQLLWLLTACSSDARVSSAASAGSSAAAEIAGGGAGAASSASNAGASGADVAGAGFGGGGSAAGASQGGSGGGDAGFTSEPADAGLNPDPSAAGAGGTGGGTGKYAGMTSIFDGTTLSGWVSSQAGLWTVMNGAIHGNGTARGYLYTTNDYEDFRVILSVRHLPSTNDHQPCVLIWGKRPPPALDALGAIQFQVPNGGSWDYRPGKNNAGDGLFTHFTHPRLDAAEWHQCEILAHTTGKARMACCTLGAAPTCTGQEFLDFNDSTAAQPGPFALQVHNAGLHDEYKDIYIETKPSVDDLVTLKW